MGFKQVLLIRLDVTVSGFNGFYRVLPSFTGFNCFCFKQESTIVFV